VNAKRAASVGLATLLVVSARPAQADRYEASVHVQPSAGVALVDDPASEETVAVPLVGLGVRASYARSNRYQYDVQIVGATTSAASFERGEFSIGGDAVPASAFTVTTRLVRLDVGATFRFGVRLVPTVRLALGVQERFRGAPIIALADGAHEGADGRGADGVTDVYGFGAVGLDYRINRRLTAGASVGGSYAVPLGGPGWRTIEASAHLAWYWYPLWFE